MIIHCATEEHKVHKIPEEPHPTNFGQVLPKLKFILWKMSNVETIN